MTRKKSAKSAAAAKGEAEGASVGTAGGASAKPEARPPSELEAGAAAEEEAQVEGGEEEEEAEDRAGKEEEAAEDGVRLQGGAEGRTAKDEEDATAGHEEEKSPAKEAEAEAEVPAAAAAKAGGAALEAAGDAPPPAAREPAAKEPPPSPAPPAEEKAAAEDMAAVCRGLEELRARLVRAQVLAELHACDAAEAAEPPAAPPPIGGGEREKAYVSLEDGALVSGESLLLGARRGERCVGVGEAAARRSASLAAARDAGAPQLRALEEAMHAALGAPLAWGEWRRAAAEGVEAGYAELRHALEVQREAALAALDARVAAGEAAAAAGGGAVRAAWGAARGRLRAVEVCSRRAAREAGEGWEHRLAAAWEEMNGTLALVAQGLEEEVARGGGAAGKGGEEACDEAVAKVVKEVYDEAVLSVEEELLEAEPCLRVPRLAVALPTAADFAVPAVPAFNAAAELSVLGEAFPPSDGAAIASVNTMLLAQRRSIEKLERQLAEQKAAAAALSARLDAAVAELHARPAKPAAPPDAPHSPRRPSAAAADGERTQMLVFSKAGVKLELLLAWEAPRRLAVACVLSNATDGTLDAVQLMAAVPRYLQLEMRPAPARSVPPGGSTSQPLVLVRETADEKPYKLKLRLEYAVHGRVVVEDIVSGSLELPAAAALPPSTPKQPAPPSAPLTPSGSSAAPPPPAPAAAPPPPTPPPPPPPSLPPSTPDAGWADFDAAFDGAAFESAPPRAAAAAPAEASVPPPASTAAAAAAAPLPPPTPPPPPPAAGGARVVPLSNVPQGMVPPHAFPAVDGSQPGRTASPRPSVGGVSEAGFDASSDWVISVSLADDLPTAVAEWCAARNLAAGAQSKIFKELTSRLDAALAQAYQDAEQEPAPVLKGVDIC
ncbi:hypothetical protein AB1Y20_019875 [Prymnesium parvum]|uniref:GAE domain-containing protein n=1 Tax=Prymnesium parvum TaxID=97485 RepID=A0AB34JS33_PRYPA